MSFRSIQLVLTKNCRQILRSGCECTKEHAHCRAECREGPATEILAVGHMIWKGICVCVCVHKWRYPNHPKLAIFGGKNISNFGGTSTDMHLCRSKVRTTLGLIQFDREDTMPQYMEKCKIIPSAPSCAVSLKAESGLDSSRTRICCAWSTYWICNRFGKLTNLRM